ncbi:hypothetical protein [Palleronia abyssalis]|uniref:hypothetical protein n=1 Tax=Palleronia abyssalis TaxID=1501240 RepID=UPI0011B1F04C|nr:hypothetical protein [Palleronia abyssalis]
MEFETIHDARHAAAAYRCVQLIVHETDLLSETGDESKFNDDNVRIIVISPRFSPAYSSKSVGEGCVRLKAP